MKPHRVNVPVAIALQTEEALRGCGLHRRECVVYWSARLPPTNTVTVVCFFHPCHQSSSIGYDVNDIEVYRYNKILYEKCEFAVAQLHTHPGGAFHSATDDHWPLVHQPGFLSIVIPDFCERGLRNLRSCYVAEFQGGGVWRKLGVDEVLRRIQFIDE